MIRRDAVAAAAPPETLRAPGSSSTPPDARRCSAADSVCASTSPALANVAVFSHYAGVPRGEGRRAGDIRIVARTDGGWFWLIPISDDLMSVGAVLPQRALQAQPRLDHGELLQRLIADTPAVARLMTGAERRWPVRVERDFSYGSTSLRRRSLDHGR